MQNICKKLSGQVISLNKNQQLINNWTITVNGWSREREWAKKNKLLYMGSFFWWLRVYLWQFAENSIWCFRIRNNLHNENYLVQLDVATSIKKACQFQVRFLLAKLTEIRLLRQNLFPLSPKAVTTYNSSSSSPPVHRPPPPPKIFTFFPTSHHCHSRSHLSNLCKSQITIFGISFHISLFVYIYNLNPKPKSMAYNLPDLTETQFPISSN